MPDPTPSLNAHDTALARHRSYALLSRLFLAGPAPDLLPLLQLIPELAAVLPVSSADETAAAYQMLFGFNVFPYESIFLDASGLLGGPVTDAVTQAYRSAGFVVQDDATSPDHVGHELAFMAFLCAAEMDAWADELPAAAARLQALQLQFLQRHLLRWLPALSPAIAQQGMPFYAAAARLLTALAAAHAADLPAAPPRPDAAHAPLPEWPPAPDLLANASTGLRDIATHLTSPALSGIYLSRDDVARLARAQNLPRGFGGRQLMLHNLLRAAVQFDALPQLLAALRHAVQGWLAAHDALDGADPAWTGYTAPWRQRAAATDALLAELAATAQTAHVSEP